MSLWKEPVKDSTTPIGDYMNAAPTPAAKPSAVPSAAEPQRRAAQAPHDAKESLIASDVTIEGKIEGTGHVRIAGRLKGDVNVEGNVTIEPGAHVAGQVGAATVVVSGEVNGNITAGARIELLEGGVITGDVKAAVFTVAAGARMRGNAEFGWGDKGPGAK